MAININKLLNLIKRLKHYEKETIYQELKDSIFPNNYDDEIVEEVRDNKFDNGILCPKCESEHVIRYGKYKGRQKYKCKSCRTYFNDLTGTPMAYTHKIDKWFKFMDCMIKGLSLRKSAEILDMSHVTLFYWRHKILSSLKQGKIDKFSKILEVDETYFLHSEKGKKDINGRKPRKRGGASKYRGISHEQVCVLVARDRSKNTISKPVCMGRINKTKIENALSSYITEKTTLCSDAWKSYGTFALEKGIEHYVINASKGQYVVKNIYHIQNVNNYHSRLKNWIQRFKGVASKYLDNYLSWFKYVEHKRFSVTITDRKDMLFKSCKFKSNETYKSLRLSKISI